eukprot:CAMPEP_0119276476 /NCGR_PEP_ID=MMETSP1329-20130426/15522_1 /TAXON_ID=114041 /ORGANISM="Genus nov. species nov., Strain RCC1024" /LENGTH=40 /DNA_ID= /DNA_START= /DNA_END= /DNA_ORIENTATION=
MAPKRKRRSGGPAKKAPARQSARTRKDSVADEPDADDGPA